MTKREGNSGTGAVLAAGATLALSLGVGLALWSRKEAGYHIPTSFDDRDVEALARMFASENPTGSERLKIEQAWTQIRSIPKGKTLYDRITNGSGWGHQGERLKPGNKRPVATQEEPRKQDRELATRSSPIFRAS